jgi:alpha-beta hydrolase superfamily lysophospholipase
MPAFPCYTWPPAAGAPPPWAAVALVHGIGSHGEAFEPLAAELAGHGVLVAAVDLPGHGRCPGPRGGLGRWDDLLAAVAALLEHTAAAAGPLPLFLLGHSLGATIAIDYVQRHPGCVRGTVVSNPALAVDPSWRLRLGRLLARVWPGFTLRTGFALEAAAHDPAALERILQDPLRHDLCSAGLATAWLAAAQRLQAAPERAPTPLLVLQSSHDPVVSPLAVERYVAAVRAAAGRAADLTLKRYDDSLHELFDDRERRQVITDLLAWLRSHAG